MRRELPQNSDRSRLIIDENPALATRGDFPAKNNCFFFRINPVGRKDPFDDLTCPGIKFKHGGNNRAISTASDYITRCFIAKQQSQSVDEDRLACAGFTCQ